MSLAESARNVGQTLRASYVVCSIPVVCEKAVVTKIKKTYTDFAKLRKFAGHSSFEAKLADFKERMTETFGISANSSVKPSRAEKRKALHRLGDIKNKRSRKACSDAR